jgi:tetratricopeptide (TPR) repeat protein
VISREHFDDEYPRGNIRGTENNLGNSPEPMRYNVQSRNPRDTSAEFIKKNSIKKNQCVCVDDKSFEWDIMKYIDDFFSNLKSMNFLGLGPEIDQYFQRFITLIRDKNLHWKKFRFVKQLIDYYLQCTYNQNIQNSGATLPRKLSLAHPNSNAKNKHTIEISNEAIKTDKPQIDNILNDMQNDLLNSGASLPNTILGNSASTLKQTGFNLNSFNLLLESIIRENRPCIHDYKLMTVLMESFGNEIYLKSFFEYMSNSHPELASMILKMLILDDFDIKSAKLYSKLFKKIFKNRQFILKNSWMYSHLANIIDLHPINIDKDILNTLYLKKRYLWLADSSNELIIQKHFTEDEITIFKIRFSSFQSLVYLLKFTPDQNEFLIKTHLQHLNTLFPNISTSEIKNHISKFLHDLLILCFFAEPQSSENLIQLEINIDVMSQYCDNIQKYKFSIILSQLAKCLFRKGLFQESLRLFTKAYYAFKGCSDKDNNSFPPFMPRTLPKNFFFNILCFITICNYHLNRVDPTIEILKTISDTKFETDTAYVEMLLMQSLLRRMTNKPDEAIEFLEKSRDYMNDSLKISSSKRKIFNIFIWSQLVEALKGINANGEAIDKARFELEDAIGVFNQDQRVG